MKNIKDTKKDKKSKSDKYKHYKKKYTNKVIRQTPPDEIPEFPSTPVKKEWWQFWR